MTPALTLDDVRAVIRDEIARVLPLIEPSPVQQPVPAPTGPWHTKLSAARHLGVSSRSIERAVEQGRLRPARIHGGRNVRFHVSDLEAWLRGESLTA